VAPPVKTVGSLVVDVARIVANTDSPQTSYANRIKGALHAALMEWYSKCRPSCLHKEATFATVVGQRDYDLADDFGLMVDGAGVWLAATPFTVLRYVTMQDYVGNRWHDTSISGDPPTDYCLPESSTSNGAQKIRLHPKPSVVRTVAYRYVAVPSSIAAAADNVNIDVRIPPQAHHGFVFGAVALLPDLLADQQRMAYFESKWRSFLSDSRAQSNRMIGVVRQRARYDRGLSIGMPHPPPTVDGTAYS